MNIKYLVVIASLMPVALSAEMRLEKDKDGKLIAIVDHEKTKADEYVNSPLPVIGYTLAGAATGLTAAFLATDHAHTTQPKITQNLQTGVLAGAATVLIYYLIEQIRWNSTLAQSKGQNLHGAAAQNNAEGVKALLNHKTKFGFWFGSNVVDPLKRDKDERTALMYAGSNNAAAAAQMLIELTPKQERILEKTAQSSATTTESNIHWLLWILKLLANKQTNMPQSYTTVGKQEVYRIENTIDSKDKVGRTAGIYAALLNNPAVLKVLLTEGANTQLKDTTNQSVETIAERNKEILQALYEHQGKI